MQVTKRMYAGNGLTRTWDVDFPLVSAQDLKVFITSPAGQTEEVTADFELNAALDTLTYPTQASDRDPLAAGWTITLLRHTPLTQEIDLLCQGEFDAEVLEQGYDKLTLLAQELSEELDRCMKYPVSTSGLSSEQTVLTAAHVDALNSGVTSAKVAQIQTHTSQISTLQSSKLSVDQAASTYATATALTQGLAEKQPVISDLANIRAGAQAGATALQPGTAEQTYLTQADAADTYATQSAVTSGLATKQDALTTAQSNAVNSGVTSSTVSQVAANLTYLSALAPYIQKYEVGNFNTQASVDTADLLAATGALHALDLDLSKNTQLGKLTAAGTSGNLANISSVLVSNEAPFDNAISPQVDVSYSNLNRAALVNLFNSMPYNVGYTAVGSPTIVDGVASGFSGSSYMTMAFPNNVSTITEWVFKAKLTSEGLRSHYNYLFRRGNFQCSAYGTQGGTFSTPTMYLPGPNASYAFTGFVPTVDTWFWLKYTYDGTTVRLYSSLDGVNYTLRNTINDVSVSAPGGNFYIGYADTNAESYFGGSIDLNETYIKVNGVSWFAGRASVTKTCDVRGCAGTTDLTSDDKAVITGKGWSLTVA